MSELVEAMGRVPRVAAWNEPLGEPNIEDARISHTLGALADVPLLGRIETAYRQRFRLKSWQYMTAVTDELFIAFVVGTAGFASNGFVYAVELPSGTIHDRFAITPLSVGTSLSPSSVSGTHRFTTRGLSVLIANRGRAFGATIDARTSRGGTLSAALEFDSTATDEHLAICVPLPGGRWNYTHKLACFTVGGHVTIDGRKIAFSPERSYGTLDFTKSYALRHAVWKWVTLCGRSKRGAVIGLNFVDPTPLAPVSENAAWIDGKREPLSHVQLIAEGTGVRDPWRVQADSVDLRSRAIAHVEQKLDVPLVRHRLRHVVAAFSGHVRTTSGQVHDLDSIVGIAEDNDTWW